MELHQLRAFTQVVDCGSFRAAANELHVTQAAVSHSIKSLESRIGATVLVRGPRGVSLTEAGEILLPCARRVVQSVDATSEDLASLNDEGTLRLATFTSASSHYLPGVMRVFHSQFPRINLDIKEGNDLDALRSLRSGKADIAFVVQGPDDVDFLHVYDDDFVLVATQAEFPNACSTEISIATLENKQIIVATGSCERVVRTALAASNVSVSYPAVARETSTALALVQANIGVTLLPRLLASNLPSGLISFDIAPRISRRIGVSIRKGERRSNTVASFLAVVTHMRQLTTNSQRESQADLSR